MLDSSLNIAGSEWLIIVFVALILILGTGRLPGAAKKTINSHSLPAMFNELSSIL